MRLYTILLLLLPLTVQGWWLDNSELADALQTKVNLTAKVEDVNKNKISGATVYASLIDQHLNLIGAVYQGVTNADGKYVFEGLEMGYYYLGVKYNNVYTFYSAKPSYNGSTMTALMGNTTRTMKVSSTTMQFNEEDALFLLKGDRSEVRVVCTGPCPAEIRVWHNGKTLPNSNFLWSSGSLTMIGGSSNLPPAPLFITDYKTGVRTSNSIIYASFTTQKKMDYVMTGGEPEPEPEPINDGWEDQGNGWSYKIVLSSSGNEWDYLQAKNTTTGKTDSGDVLKWTTSEFDEHGHCNLAGGKADIVKWFDGFVAERTSATPYWEGTEYIYECPGQLDGTSYWTGTESITECRYEQCVKPVE